ncbi:hypothetical protein PV327_007979 [Microctonus hyperodae]|uniref:Uncharacterized protein n=1 Tax=Microctonus hyperodae TaxID=165561 RepID=A0AA39G0B6_MICHY|nr:hypothetical protein PV327_007979 [Microctonus hyperodae]
MDCNNLHESHINPVEVIRNELRHTTKIEREHHRIKEWNKRRVALGEIVNNEKLWDLATVVNKSKEIKKKTLSIDDYLKLQMALIQSEENIGGFLSITGTIPALLRDITSANPAIKLTAAHCLCNITLANSKRCSTLYKYAGPYIIEQLETLSNPLLEVSAWTIGNLSSGSKSAFKSLYAQGCINRLLSLLRECDTMILHSLIYAITHCLYGGSELMSDTEIVEIAKILVERSCFENTSGLWALALLTSRVSCRDTIFMILPTVFDKLVIMINDEYLNVNYITAVIRLLANSVDELPGSTADVILNNPKYSLEDVNYIFDKLLLHPHVHVRKETLWLLGIYID